MEPSEVQNRLIGDYIVSAKKIGSGSFSSVYIGRDRRDGTEVAVKEIDKTKLGHKVKESLLKEITILRQVSHPNIVRLHQAIQTEEKIYLVLEYCTGGDLAAYIGRRGRVSENLARHFMRQLGEGLKVLRENNLIHRDLKPQNLFLCATDEAPVLKIGDFGFARYLMPQGLADTLCGSPLYMAPEIIQKKKYDAKADLWSVGAILYQLVTGKPLLMLFHNVLASEELKFPQDMLQRLHPDCVNLCRGLLRQNPLERLTFSEFFNHKFMALPRSIDCPLELTQNANEVNSGYPFVESSNSDVHNMKSEAIPMVEGLSRESTPKFADSFESIEREYVLVHAHFASMESLSSSLGMSLKENTSEKSLSYTNKNIDLTAASIVPSDKEMCTTICGTENKGSQIHASSLLLKTSTQSDMVGKSSSLDPSCQLKLLCQYVFSLTELAQDKHKNGLLMESFSIELIALAVWKKALQICNSWISSSIVIDQINSLSITESSQQKLEHFNLNSSESVDFNNPSSVCSWLEQGFILSYDRAEKISHSLHKIDGDLEMPDAMDMIFRSALYAGKCGGVDELIGQKSRAVALYLRAIILFSFILNEASSLPLNPPFSLSPADQQRIHKYIIILHAHLNSSQV